MRLKVVINWAPFPHGSLRLVHQEYALTRLLELAPEWCTVVLSYLPGEASPTPLEGFSVPLVRLPREASRDTDRRLPYMRDTMEAAIDGAEAADWGGFLNSDIIVTPRFFSAIQDAVRSSREVIICHRTDIRRADQDPETGIKVNQRTCTDGFFLRGSAWSRWDPGFPDYVLGEPWWDSGTIWWSKAKNFSEVHLGDHEILHINHRRYWRRKSLGAQYNSRLGMRIWKGIK